MTALDQLYEFTLEFRDLLIDRRVLERALGYKREPAPQIVSDAIDEILPALPSLCRIRYAFSIIPPERYAVAPLSLTCDGAEFLLGRIITKRFAHASSAAVFVATAGAMIEQWSHQLMSDGDMLKGFIVDTAGSEIAELVGDHLELKLAEVVQPLGWKLTNRYSPGYCEWTVAEQHKLFSLLPNNVCGIRLTPSALMVPIKSVSGIIGLGADVHREAYTCSICDLQDCFRRRDEPEYSSKP